MELSTVLIAAGFAALAIGMLWGVISPAQRDRSGGMAEMLAIIGLGVALLGGVIQIIAKAGAPAEPNKPAAWIELVSDWIGTATGLDGGIVLLLLFLVLGLVCMVGFISQAGRMSTSGRPARPCRRPRRSVGSRG